MDFSKLRLNEIKEILDSSSEADVNKILDCLAKDNRKWMRNLVSVYQRKITKSVFLKSEFLEKTSFEARAKKQGFSLIAGVDESGRGALAGPLVAAAVILPENFFLPGLKDCKELSSSKREEFYPIIIRSSIDWAIAIARPSFIDKNGIQRANLEALTKAVKKLNPAPDYILSDAFFLSEVKQPNLGIKSGDKLSISIAAASIISKVTRDRIMRSYHKEYSEYGFDQHKGYGTSEHLMKIKEVGPSRIHRYSFAGVS